MNNPINKVIILIIISLSLILFIIYDHKNKQLTNNERDPPVSIRPSYGNEFYNYYGGDSYPVESTVEEETVEDNIKETIYEVTQTVEGFDSTDEGIIEEHRRCPVMEGNSTNITSCIHYPNRQINGYDGVIDSGFLVSVCCNTCLNRIQQSLDGNDGVYDIIYRDDNFILTKDQLSKQTLLECNPTNLSYLINELGTETE